MSSSCANLVQDMTASVAEDFQLDTRFYKKYVEALGGIAVVSSDQTSDAALIQMAKVINVMMQNREDVARLIADLGIQFTVMAAYPTEVTTDVPEHSNMDSSYWDERARGLGSTCGSLVTSGSEENALCYSDDRYRNSCIGLHEFAHTVHERGMMSLYPMTFNRVRELFKTRSAHLYDDTYANTNENEFWAELSQAYFDCQVNDGLRPATRQDLLELHPEMYAVMLDFYGDISLDPCPNGDIWGTESINVDCDDFWAGNAPRDYSHFPLPPTPECPCIQHFQETPLCSPTKCIVFEDSEISIDPRIQSCTSDVLTTSPAATPDPALTTRIPRCEDSNSNCQYWASVGECEANPGYMLVYCAKSCNQCDIQTWIPTIQPTEYVPHPCGCEDSNFNCEGWAASGECQINPNYMLWNCRVSCNTCPQCDVDCEGFWSGCSSDCETASERVFTVTTAQFGNGEACPSSTSDCNPGDGQCRDTASGDDSYTCGTTMEECEAAYMAAMTPAVTAMMATETMDSCDAADGWWVSGTLNGLAGYDADTMSVCQSGGEYMIEYDGMVYPTCVAYGDPTSACGDSDLICPENPNSVGVFGYAGNQRAALASALTRNDFMHPMCPTSTCKSMDELADSGSYWKTQLMNNQYTSVDESTADNVCVTEDNEVMFITTEGKYNTCLGWSSNAAELCDSQKFLCAGHNGQGLYTYGWPGQLARTLAKAVTNTDGNYMHPQCPLMICSA